MGAENALLSPAIHAAVNVGVLMLAYPGIIRELGYREPVLIGAGAEVVGGYLYDGLLKGAIMAL
jgi:hypothetical protein